MRLRRPWPFQKWRKSDLGIGPVLIIHHSKILGLFKKCKCAGCVFDKYQPGRAPYQ